MSQSHRHTCRYSRLAFALAAACVVTLCSPVLAADYVIHISVDGLHPGHLQKVIDAGEAPNFKRLETEGAWTANARTDFTHTITLPNHTCMLTGRPVAQPDGMPGAVFHGYTSNNLPRRGVTLQNFRRNAPKDYIASVFDVVHEAGRSTAMYASKDKFVIYEQTYNPVPAPAQPSEANSPGAPSATASTNTTAPSPNKMDLFFYQEDPAPTYSSGMQARFLTDMAAKHYNYVFVHYRDADTAGHAERWGSGSYRQALRSVDGYLGEIFHLVEADQALAGHTTIIVNTDHGGIDLDHSKADLADDYTIPVFVWGAGVKAGDLYMLNKDSRGDPGTDRPDYNAEKQPIRNGDTGNLALKLLGLGPIPGSIINAKQDLRMAP